MSGTGSTFRALMEQHAFGPQPSLGLEKAFVRDLVDGQPVDAVFEVRERMRRQKKNGDAFLKLELGDATGTVEAVAWDGLEEISACSEPGSAVMVSGRFAIDPRYGGCLTIRAMREAEPGEYRAADLADGPAGDLDKMIEDLRSLLETMQSPHLRALLDRFFGEGSGMWVRWREAPAAKHYHQAYRHGLLEHCLSVAQAVSAISATFPGIDRDIAVAGALLHDIGKVDAYRAEGGAIELTDVGKLHGEIALGYYVVRREIEDLPGFPSDVEQALLHIILSHHGQLEHGSPVIPCTREATLVHMIDNLGGRLGSFDRLEKKLTDGEHWSDFDRALSSSAWFPPRADEREAA